MKDDGHFASFVFMREPCFLSLKGWRVFSAQNEHFVFAPRVGDRLRDVGWRIVSRGYRALYPVRASMNQEFPEEISVCAGEDERLLREYLPHVKRIVHRIAAHVPSYVDSDDLLNAGILGLLSAVKSFEPCRGTPFLSYAVFRIKGAVLSELRSRDFLSRGTRRQRREMEKTCEMLEQRLGREATDPEIASEMGISLDEYNRVRREAGLCVISLDEISCSEGEGWDAGEGMQVEDPSSNTLKMIAVKEMQEALGKAIDELPEKDRLVVSLYYWDELNMKEIGEVLGITESRVSQIHSRAVMRLRSKLAVMGNVEGRDE